VIMSNRDPRLVLGCITLAIELVRLANKLVVLLNVAINYIFNFNHESKMDFKISA
jgi:hypothetical protein